jgi:hypothetical protein
VWMGGTRQQIETGCAGPSGDPGGPAAVLGVSMSSPALASPRSSLASTVWPFWTYGSIWFERNYKFALRRLPGRGKSGSMDPFVLPSSICARAVPLLPGLPRLLKFGDDVPPD